MKFLSTLFHSPSIQAGTNACAIRNDRNSIMETTHLSPSPAFNNTLTPPQRQHKFFQLAQSQCMSPSMMTSCAPSPDQSDAFVPMSASSNEYWANSAVQGYVQDSEHLLPVSRPNLSIPDASNQDTSMHNKVSFHNLLD